MNPARKTRKRTIACIITAVLAAILLGSAFYMQWYALQAQGNARGKDLQGSYTFMFQRYPHIKAWHDSLQTAKALRDTFITSEDQIRLHAFYIPSDSSTSKTAVVIHGYTDNAIRMLHIAYLYHHDLHYNVFLPELRYSGLSDGSHIQMAWLDRTDIINWLKIANQIFAPNDSTDTQMVIHGISMGAATTMCTSGETLPDYVNCMVEDCGYTSVWDEYKGQLKEQFHLTAFPLLYLTSWLTDLRYGWNFKEASPLEQIKKSKYPMLFIHGDKDTFVPTWMGDSLYAIYRGPKTYWRVPGAEHAESYLKYPKEYTEKVRKFTLEYNH